MAKRGGKREGAGRKPLALEHKARDLTSPYIPNAVAVLVEIMEKGEKDADRISAARILMSYYWGQPKQQADITSNGETVNTPTINVLTTDAAETIKKMYE